MKKERFEVAIIGAGPGGLSAAARAAQRGVSYILLEASDKHANTIQQYQKGKHVMAEPSVLPLRSDIAFRAGARESVLDAWNQTIVQTEINIRYLAQVTSITGMHGDFCLALQCGDQVRAENVVLALGVQGNPRRLNVPGEELEFVQSSLESADDYQNETIVLIGAGDSAIENAIALARQNRVTLVNRRSDFVRAKEANANRVRKAIENGLIDCFYETTIDRIERFPADTRFPGRIVLNTPEGERAVACHRIITRLGATPPRAFVESCGVRFASDAADAPPELSLRYESNVPGIYLIGSLAGYPLIKQALNQGYEVIEHILGHPVTSSDHAVLRKKFSGLPFGEDVEETLASIRQRVRLFHNINPLNLRELMLVGEILRPAPGEVICARGSYSSTFYTLLQGTVQVNVQEDGEVLTLNQGQLFGELSLISGRRRLATVIAGEDCILLASPPRAIKKLMRLEESVRRKIDKVSIVRTVNLFLLPHAPMKAVHTLASETEIHRFDAGETLFQEGDPVARVYLVRSGSVTLSRKIGEEEVVVAYCAAGNYVDLVDLSGKTRRTVSARATVFTEVLSIDQHIFSKILQCDPDLHRSVQSERKKQLARYTQMQSEPERGDVVSFLMAHGVGEATDVLIIDESLCVDCNNCEIACAATHQGISRLDRKAGPSFASLLIPTSCRHCENPHCTQDCPPDAIHRLENGEISINESCIGCGNCVDHCPYGVIQLAEVMPKVSILDRILGNVPAESTKTAVKCDMCKDLKGGSACVNSCPTGAAIRIHAEQAVALANERAVP